MKHYYLEFKLVNNVHIEKISFHVQCSQTANILQQTTTVAIATDKIFFCYDP